MRCALKATRRLTWGSTVAVSGLQNGGVSVSDSAKPPGAGSVTFDETDTRRVEMHETIDTWLVDFVDAVADARASDAFQRWLDVESRFHDYSYRNTLLMQRQCPRATRVAGYRA